MTATRGTSTSSFMDAMTKPPDSALNVLEGERLGDAWIVEGHERAAAPEESDHGEEDADHADQRCELHRPEGDGRGVVRVDRRHHVPGDVHVVNEQHPHREEGERLAI